MHNDGGFDWSHHAEECFNNLALMAQDEEDHVLEHLCSPKCIEKVNMYRQFIEENKVGIESLNVLKAGFKRAEDDYKIKIQDLVQTISLLKHEATNYKTQIADLISKLAVEAITFTDKYSLEEEMYKTMLSTCVPKNNDKNKKGVRLYNKYVVYTKIEPSHTFKSVR
jgi:hypothetical protein